MKQQIPTPYIYAITILVVALAAIGAWLFINSRNTNLRELEVTTRAKERQSQQVKLDECLATSEKRYNLGYREAEKRLGITENAGLPVGEGELIEQQYKELKDNCYKQFDRL